MFGYRSFLWNGICWRSLPYGAALLSSPRDAYHLENATVRNSFFRFNPDCLYVRWEKHFDSLNSSPWWHIIKDKNSGYLLETYSSKVRNQVRRGLRSYYCKPINVGLVAKNYFIYSNAFDSYDTFEAKCNELDFTKSLRILPLSTEFWGLFTVNGDELVGFSENFIDSNTCFFNSIWILPTAVKNYASYVLFYEMIKYYLKDRGFDYVSDGAKSLSHNTQIHQFLVTKFRFRKAYSVLCVEYVPWLKFLIFLAYPFSKIFLYFDSPFMNKLRVLLNMEGIRRSCMIVK